MFDKYSADLFRELPKLPDLDPENCRRILTTAYLMVLDRKHFNFEEVTDSGNEGNDQVDPEENTEPPSEQELKEQQITSELRRLGDALESAAVFDDEVSRNIKVASAFVAAESFSLLARYYERRIKVSYANSILLLNDPIYTRIESALLYLIAGYDANASTEVAGIDEYSDGDYLDTVDDPLVRAANWTLDKIISLCKGTVWPIDHYNCPYTYELKDGTLKLQDIVRKNMFQMYSMIGEAVAYYLGWLAGESDGGFERSENLLEKVVQASSIQTNALYPNIYHLAKLLLATIKQTSIRSIIHNIPSPPDGEAVINEYLRSRAKGGKQLKPRPFLWPSTQQFVEQCLPGPKCNAVISMPTGSGKSFIAELAISHALVKGWVLYLAPTNALTHQIRRDLMQGLESYTGVEIRSFVGNEEYSVLSQDVLTEDHFTTNFVAVMTPEKCALALRISPDIFEKCSLCIFDECHLLGEGNRGVLADIVLGQLISINDNIKFLLMSAMVNNPNEVSEWLEERTGVKSVVPPITWRPTRTIRGAVGVIKKKAVIEYRAARERLMTKKPRFKNEDFSVPITALFGLSGVWQLTEKDDYLYFEFEANTILAITREKIRNEYNYKLNRRSWTNNTARSLGSYFATNGIPSIVFFPYNKNDVFTVDKSLDLRDETRSIPEKITHLLTIADAELGLESEVGRLINKQGISVHSSAMLESEKEASEEAFKSGISPLMYGTGTLAQGLNLPSVAVIIAGTSVGDRRNANDPDTQKRAKASILNAMGRAGRAGFANQSLSLIVPDKPIFFEEETDPEPVLKSIDVLKDIDASIKLESPLELFIDRIINKSFQPDRASDAELLIVSYLSDIEADTSQKKNILQNTFAAYRRKTSLFEDDLREAGNFIKQIKQEFLEQTKAPEWVVTVARKSGFDFFTALRFAAVVQNNIHADLKELSTWPLEKWHKVLFLCLSKMPPRRLVTIFPEYESQRQTPINQLQQAILEFRHVDELEWIRPQSWDGLWEEFQNLSWMHMSGESIKFISSKLLDQEVSDPSRSAGKPIPTGLSFLFGPINEISRYAGLLVATLEELYLGNKAGKDEEITEQLPVNLSALPLAVKHGCNNYSTLCWYRFGIRFRVVAHTLSAIFPLQEGLNDAEARDQILKKRREWLRGDVEPVGSSDEQIQLLEAAKSLIRRSYKTT
ncbi:DEAD/DEAH box helicase [Paenibacillus naphthalenovorans]|uniref:DEAD/DEAH box helicase n=1 Tax=Paenibacillus naphthalenovorans TaxID=162209 RepID=UPI003D2B1476